MPMVIGGGSVTGLNVGGLPAGTVNTASLADSSITTSKIGFTGSVLQTRSTASTTQTSSNVNSAWTEPSTSYRVTITPIRSNSIIIISYHIPVNMSWGGAANCLKVFRSFRSIGGTKAYNLSNQGTVSGSRMAVAGFAARALNGYDTNDQQNLSWTSIDAPATTSAVTYGFEYLQESSNAGTLYFGYSNSDNSTWGYTSGIVITAMEIAQ